MVVYYVLIVIRQQKIMDENKKKDLVLLIYDWTKITPQPTNPACVLKTIQIPIQWYSSFPEVFAEFFLHELCHYFYQKTGQIDVTHSYDVAFMQKPRKDYYLYLLEKFKASWPRSILTPPVPNTYKYFKPSEIVGLKPELVLKLDQAREKAGVPFVITSGYRTTDTNELVGGVADSSHTTGLAVDIATLTSYSRYRSILGLLGAGFNRIGVYKKHLHCDIDTTKPKEVVWYL